MNSEKKTGSVEMPFGVVGQLGPRNHVDGVRILHDKGQIFGGNGHIGRM